MKKRKASEEAAQLVKFRTDRIEDDETVFPFLELPVEIFRIIVSVLHDPTKAINKNAKNLFITSNAVRQKYMKVFMEFLWFELNGKRKPKLSFSNRIENLYRPTKTIELSLFPCLHRLDIGMTPSTDIRNIPIQIVSLQITSVPDSTYVDLSSLVNLKHLSVFSPYYSRIDSICPLLTIGSEILESLVADGVRITKNFNCSHLKSIRLGSVRLLPTLRLQHSLDAFLFYPNVTTGGGVELARGDEVKKLSETFQLVTIYRRYKPTPVLKTHLNAVSGAEVDSPKFRHLADEDRETLRWWLQK